MDTLIMSEKLKCFPFLKGLDDHQFKQIAEHAIVKTEKKKSILYIQDDPVDYIHFLIKGKVKLFNSDSKGKVHINEILKAGDVFPLENVFHHERFTTYYEVIEDATIIMIPKTTFKELIIMNEHLCINTLQCLSDKLLELYDKLAEKTLFPVCDQILSLLSSLCRKHGQQHQNNWVTIDLYFSNSDLARMIGTTRETMSRCINELIQDEVIKYNEKNHLMIHFEKLKQLIESGSCI